ncbi:MAG: hypothetical protein K8R59_04670 [Thermoanaerobaculales bacterium]|nr:hypothetical protein [Thermoanaerobaculales bacterium]
MRLQQFTLQIVGVALVVLTMPTGPVFAQREECTSAILGPEAGVSGAPILWKNRDTNTLSNRVVFVQEQPFTYLALVNWDDPSGRRCFAGLNSEGFAIMNTVAYNLPEIAGEAKDLEGTIMADALRTCRTVEEFASYLEANRGRHFGSLANFGVIDAEGGAAIFEAHNHGFYRLDTADAALGYLVNTNFARTGKEGEGAGYLRFERATTLFEDLGDAKIPFETILTEFSRDIGHVLLHRPSWEEMARVPADEPVWISTRDGIDKYYTSATVVIEGRQPNVPGSVATMWVLPGEPLSAVAVPLWVEAQSSPEALHQGEPDAQMWAESLRIKKIVRPYREGHKIEYLNLTPLVNRDGGFRARLDADEAEIMRLTSEFLQSTHTPAEYRAFQEMMTRRALDALRSVGEPPGDEQISAEIEHINDRALETLPLKVGVYADGGASPVCVTETMAALKIDPGIAPVAVRAVDLMTGVLNGLDVIVFPGGSGSKQASSMGSQGREKVRRWVLEEGKGCLGICAGGYLLSSTPVYKWSMKLISANVIDRAHYNRGRGLMEVGFTDAGRKRFPEIGPDMPTYLQYYDGPVLVRSTTSELPPYEELATYVSDIHLSGGSSPGVTPGKTALLVNDAGKGKVGVCVGHPEATPGMRWVIPRMVRMVADRKLVSYPSQVIRPHRESREILFDTERASEEQKLFWQLVGDDPEEKMKALRTLVQMRSRPALRWAEGLLRDDDPGVRRLAGAVLEEAEYTPAIDDLGAAVRLEQDEILREALRKNLEGLEGIVTANAS